MEYIGLDVHRKHTYFTRMDASGHILHQGSVANGEILQALPEQSNEVKVAMEATGNWYHLYDLLEGVVDEIYLAHPLKTRVIAEARVKTDKIDSEALAHLLRMDLLPCAYIPPRDVRNLRDLLRYRAALVRVRTGLKNRVHALLAKNGLLKAFSDTFGKRGRSWLASLSFSEEHRLALDGLVAVNDTLETQLDLISKEIDRRARANPEAVLLTSMPGIGYYSALLIMAEIGDVCRFPNSRRLTAYAGLVPSVRASGGQVRHGHITKQGSRWLRWIMVEAAQLLPGSGVYRGKYGPSHLTLDAAFSPAHPRPGDLVLLTYSVRNEGFPARDVELEVRTSAPGIVANDAPSRFFAWLSGEERGVIPFTALAPGKYTLTVEARSNTGASAVDRVDLEVEGALSEGTR